MDLSEFVRQSLEDVTQGVHKAQSSCSKYAHIGATRMGYKLSGKVVTASTGPTQRDVEFDVAVCVTEAAGKGGEARIVVFGIGLGGGLTTEAQTSTTHRIKFSVPVAFLPLGD